MNELELRMNYSAFIKLKDFVKINDISAEIKEYFKKNDTVDGNLSVSGNYLRSDMEKVNNFSDVIPFSIMFKDSSYEILDIDCVNLDYHVVDGRGIEVEFDIQVRYFDEEEKEEEEIVDEDEVIEIPVIVEEEVELDEVVEEIEDTRSEVIEETYEEVKEEKTEEIDELIAQKLSYVDDNLPSEVELGTFLPERKSYIRVCYYDADNDLEKVCEEKHIGIDKVFKDNKNTDFTKYRRIIIK